MMPAAPGEPHDGRILSEADVASGPVSPEPEPELLPAWLPPPLDVLERWLFRLLQAVTVASFLLLLLALAWKMLRRQVGGPAVPDEIETLLFTWMLFIGAAALVRGWKHIDVPLIPAMLRSRHWRLLHRAAIILLSLLFIWYFYRSGMALIAGSARRTSPMLRLPQIYWYASMGLSAALMGFYAVLQLVGIGVALVKDRRGDRNTST
jgi:TRAP-type transport system small permease protein